MLEVFGSQVEPLKYIIDLAFRCCLKTIYHLFSIGLFLKLSLLQGHEQEIKMITIELKV